MIRRRHFGTLLVALLLAVPAARAAGNNCSDGGRPRPDEGGIGGTGAHPTAPDEGGIGGTGISATDATGIIGTITGFASVCVGGVEIHYATDTPVEVDGQTATTAQLAVGHIVEVVASGTGSELRARQISLRHVVSGSVTRVDAERNELDVIGQTVQLSAATRAGGGDEEYAAAATLFPLHSFVQVSGLRRGDGVIVASRITRSEARDVAQLTGPVTKLAPGVLAIAGTQVRIDDRVQPALDDEVHVIGRWDGSAIVAGSVESLPSIPFDGRVPRLDIEGYARESIAGQLRVGPFLVELPQATRPPAADVRVRIQAVVRDRRVIVERLGMIGDLPILPPMPDRELKGGSGSGPADMKHVNGEPPPFDQSRADDRGGAAPPSRDDHGGMQPGAPDFGDGGPPPHPDRPSDRPSQPQIPDRPPDRPEPPQVPDRPERPQPHLSDRPNRSERPPRPDMHGRP